MLSDTIKCSWCDEDAVGYAFKEFRGAASCGDYGHGSQFELDRSLLAEHDRAVAERAWDEGHHQTLANIAWPKERKDNPYRKES